MSWDSMMLKTSAKITIHPIGEKKSAICPWTKTKGKKAAMVVNTPKITGVLTSQVPSMAACFRFFPCCS